MTFQLPRLGLGCMALSGIYGSIDRSVAWNILAEAWKRGVTHFDTADLYGAGENERLLSQFLASHRGEATVATKFGYVVGANGAIQKICGRPDYVRACCEQASRACGSTSSTSIICIGSTRRRQSRKQSARWPNSFSQAKCAISACRR